MLTSLERSRWARCIAALRKELPPPYPVRVRTVRQLDFGTLSLERENGKRYFDLRISCIATFTERLDALKHEWAHALCPTGWNDDSERDEHDEAWGIWYARAYQVVDRALSS